ncbi:glycosyltransferase family 4 protein [Zhongshania aliphaticivorans]|uniref:Glycosyl transferase family 1 domain-containing protein n=1 Tax=Zhongshania aliphaticivorans TaxID=1470434 RepID=A0A127M190_9GAMM|nr:glycosyltransferase family 4 protein [Zhongshania aliphaticivorans]AMO66991.1 hypothetical protein AZF00_01155 [Zhongshania aliphaticivorans]
MSALNQKVLFTTHVGSPGGAEIKMLELLNAVEQREVLLFEKGSLFDTIKAKGVPVIVEDLNKGFRQYKREGSTLSALKVIPSLFKASVSAIRHARNYEIIVCMSQKSFVVFALSKVIHRKKIVWFMNDIVSSEHFSGFSRTVIKSLARVFADTVVLNSKSSLHEWQAAGMHSKREVVIYSGVNTTRPKPSEDTSDIDKIKEWQGNAPLIGMFGRITHWKGQHVFIEALSKLPNHKAIVVGGTHFEDDSYASSLAERAAQLKLSNQIKFVGHRANIFDYIDICDTIVHCSVLPEPFGRVIVEAMLMEKIVIATAAGGATEIVKDEESGYLYPPGDAEELARKIKVALANPSRQTMQRSAKRRAEELFSSDKMCQDFQQLLSSV